MQFKTNIKIIQISLYSKLIFFSICGSENKFALSFYKWVIYFNSVNLILSLFYYVFIFLKNSHCPRRISTIPGVIIVYPMRENDLGNDWIFKKSNNMVERAGSKKKAILGPTKLGKSLPISLNDIIRPIQSTILPYMKKAKS